MGISDYLWPYEKKFSEIPCAREAGLAGLLAGSALGALSIIRYGHGRYAVKTTTYTSLAVFWVAFIMCRVENSRLQKVSNQFIDAIKTGKID